MTSLDSLFKKHGCDKHTHHYSKVYERSFAPRREDPLQILEVGIWMGNSTAALLEYFPNATLYGIDVFTRIAPEAVKVLSHPRVRWLRGDSTDSSLPDMIREKWGAVEFDIIIDDGKHTPNANRTTFNNLVSFLKQDGTYWIEDVWPIDALTDDEIQANPWFNKHPGEYTKEKMSAFLNSIDDYHYRSYDLREKAVGPNKAHLNDSYLYEIRKS